MCAKPQIDRIIERSFKAVLARRLVCDAARSREPFLTKLRAEFSGKICNASDRQEINLQHLKKRVFVSFTLFPSSFREWQAYNQEGLTTGIVVILMDGNETD